ncbi:MAG: substrate-binding domain-containing protein [Lachnospiraceae bacterium]|nr:substrate-binding domain-containing protein [Lachnospiraceae bacterium]
MEKKDGKRSIGPIVATGVIIIVLLFIFVNLIYNRIIDEANMSAPGTGETYARHIAMIVGSPQDEFWQDVYKHAKEDAAERDCFVELKETGNSTVYTLSDLMTISIASGVDGIIVENDGSEGLKEKIDEASDAGIQVVTVLNDAADTKRVSYVGLNPYTAGKMYSEKLIPILKSDKSIKNIAVFMKDDRVDGNDFQIFSDINTELMGNEELADRVTITAVRIPKEKAFGTEEVVQETLEGEIKPELVICLDSMTTETVYQSIIDMNLAGEVQMIGYYDSPNTVGALKRNNMLMTLVISTEDMGAYASQAVSDAIETGRTNSYYAVNADFISSEDVR